LQIDYADSEASKVKLKRVDAKGEFEEIFVRARVRNTGRQTGKGVLVYVTSLTEVGPSGTLPTSLHDSKLLAWAGHKLNPQDIPGGGGVNFYVDLMKVSTRIEEWGFCFELFDSQMDLKKYKGTYRFQLIATADNASPAAHEIDVTYHQDWHTLRAKSHQKK